METLKHFMLPEHTNTLYENEAISSISLTKEVADKINELVDVYNKFAKLDLEWKQTQEGTIRKGVVYMKDNLVNTLNDLMDLYINNGFVDRRIEYHIDGLIERVNNLVTSISEDSEVIDVRYGSGITFDTAGEAVRKQIYNLNAYVSELYNSLNGDNVVNYTAQSGYIDSDLTLHAPKQSQKEITTGLIPIADNDVYKIVTNYDVPADNVQWIGVTYYNNTGKPIERTSEENITEKLIFKTKEEYSYFAVSVRTFGNGTMVIQKKNLKTVCATVPTYQHKYDYQYQPLTFTLGFLNSAGEIMKANEKQVELCSDLVKVNAGEKYALILNAVNKYGIVGNNTGYLWGAVAYYDLDGNYLYRPHAYPVTEERADQTYSVVGEFTIPAGVGYIRVMGRTYWNGTINLALKRDIITGSNNVITFENMTAGVKGIAHRGYSAGAPENTLPAFKLAKQNGFYYVECDVRFTSDNVAVLLHDATVDRTSNGTGEITSLTLDQVKNLDFGAWFSNAYEGVTIPTFEEFISLCKKIGLHPYIELKGGTQEQIESLVELVKAYGMLDKVTWIGGSPFNTYITPLDPKARIGVVVSSITSSNLMEAKNLQTGENEVFMDSNSYTDTEIQRCKKFSIGLEVWTINNEQDILNLPSYISGVTSDNYHAGILLYEKSL